MTNADMLKEVRSLAAGTLAGLFKTNHYARIEERHQQWLVWLAKEGKEYDTWQDAWQAYSDWALRSIDEENKLRLEGWREMLKGTGALVVFVLGMDRDRQCHLLHTHDTDQEMIAKILASAALEYSGRLLMQGKEKGGAKEQGTTHGAGSPVAEQAGDRRKDPRPEVRDLERRPNAPGDSG